jgi:hypothetical protein
VKLNIDSVEVHPQLSHNGLPMDGALVGAGLPWPLPNTSTIQLWIANFVANFVM